MPNIDKRGKLDEGVFSYKITKNNKAFISYHGKVVTTLSGNKALGFIAAIKDTNDKDEQLIMAKATGHFKHGNERLSKQGGKR